MSEYEDQIDLRPYILASWQRKWWILLLTVLFGATAVVYSLTTPETYSSEATLLLTRSSPVLSLAEQFPTVNEPIDTRSRMEALLSIAVSDALIQQTIQDLGAALPVEYRSIRTILKMLEVSNKGDSITGRVTARDPELAAEIANTWARQMITTVNLAYSGEQPLNEIQGQLVSAKSEYDSAQAALEDFIRQNTRFSLEQEYAELKVIYDLLGSERAVQTELLMKRKQALQELSYQAQALMSQLESGSQSTAGKQGDALAVLLARMMASGIQPSTSNLDLLIASSTGASSSRTSEPQGTPDILLSVQLSPTDDSADTAADFVSDLETIIRLAEEEKEKVEAALNTLTHEIFNSVGASPEIKVQATSKLQELQTQIESLRSQEQKLISSRDLAWKAYQAMAEKETEIKNAALTSNLIALSSPAVPAQEREPRGTVTKVLVALILGGMIGVIWAVLTHWWKSANLD